MCGEYDHGGGRRWLKYSVHPHVLGEYEELRGKPADPVRFIPTCTGNTQKGEMNYGTVVVHPHMRGEYDSGQHVDQFHVRFIPTCMGNTPSSVSISRITYGSSPRMWGIQYFFNKSLTIQRFIPTYVGNTNVFGEQFLWDIGSSPRMWGIHNPLSTKHGHYRFIPTCVGNTHQIDARVLADTGSSPRVWGTLKAARLRGKFPSVHPHVRGESLNFGRL